MLSTMKKNFIAGQNFATEKNQTVATIKIGMEWVKKGVPLINNVRQAVEINKDKLSRILMVKPSEVWNELQDDSSIIRKKRIEILQKSNTKTPINLVRQLYSRPTHSLMNGYKKSHDIDLLYQEYCKTNFSAIEPQHLNKLMDTFLSVTIQRPVSILSSEQKLSNSISHGYAKLRILRNKYVSQLTKIFRDFADHGVPVSVEEQTKFLNFAFFIDRSDINRKIIDSFARFGKEKFPENEFTFEFYKRFNVKDTKSLNNFLRLSIRHQQRQVFDDILNSIKPDRETFKLLLQAYTFEFKHQAKFQDVINQIDVPMDITLLNAISEGYIVFGDVEAAENLVKLIETPDDNLPFVYKYMTTEDKDTYDRYTGLYDRLSAFVEMPPIQIIPNIDTYTPFVRLYSKTKNFDKLVSTLDVINSMHLPLTTKTYKMAFRGATEQQVLLLLPRLIEDFESQYTFDEDLANKSIYSKVEGGQFVKLPDSLIGLIVKPLVKYDTVAVLYQRLKEDIHEVRLSSSFTDIYKINQVTYLKRNFLHQLYTISLENPDPIGSSEVST